jgi:hypothetical protein
MKLEFDSISELEQFLMFSAHIGQAFTARPQAPAPAKMDEATVSDNGASSALSALSGGEPAGEDAGADADEVVADTAPKRKRRTKAEIAAGEAAALQARGDSGELAVDATQALAAMPATVEMRSSEDEVPAGRNANPFAQSPATQAILEAPTHAASLAAAGEAMQRPLEVSGIDHLRACQSFIQAHGMQKYNESFRDGLNANIATYTAEQRAQHVGVLHSLAT